MWRPVPRQTVFRHKTAVSRCAFTTTDSTPADFNQRQPVGVSRSTVSCGLIAEASRLRHPGACSRHSVARRPPIPVSESQAIRLPYRVAVYVELTRPTYRAHHTGDSWLLVIRLPPRLLRCGCYMMFHLFVVSGSGQPAGFTIGWAPTFSGTPALAELPMPMRLWAVRGAFPVATHHPSVPGQQSVTAISSHRAFRWEPVERWRQIG